MKMAVRHLDWGKCDWFNPKPSVKRKVYQGSENCTISMGVIQPGHVPGPHKHDYEQTVIIVKGKCDFHVDDEVYTFDADFNKDGGMCFMTIPAGAMHWIENPYDEPVYNMDLFIPKRTADREESVEVR
jgi:quercetin dioxygenase-like cupin family protein